ncbi:MAG: hypothetical protein RLZZ500_780 [Bacteroidota bacterium]|jgi:hypothetical protein
MAQLHANQRLHGMVGPVYVRTLNGNQIIQSKPVFKKKKGAPKKSTQDFSVAVRLAQQLRKQLEPIWSLGADAHAQQRLTGVLYKSIQNQTATTATPAIDSRLNANPEPWEINTLSPFEKSKEGSFDCTLTSDKCLTITGQIVLNPSLKNKKNDHSAALHFWTLIQNNDQWSLQTFNFPIENILTATTIDFTTAPLIDGSTVFVFAHIISVRNSSQLPYTTLVNNKTWNPCCLLCTIVI